MYGPQGTVVGSRIFSLEVGSEGELFAKAAWSICAVTCLLLWDLLTTLHLLSAFFMLETQIDGGLARPRGLWGVCVCVFHHEQNCY